MRQQTAGILTQDTLGQKEKKQTAADQINKAKTRIITDHLLEEMSNVSRQIAEDVAPLSKVSTPNNNKGQMGQIHMNIHGNEPK